MKYRLRNNPISPAAANNMYAKPIEPNPVKILPPASSDPDASMNIDTTAGSLVLIYSAMHMNVRGMRKNPEPNRSVKGPKMVLKG